MGKIFIAVITLILLIIFLTVGLLRKRMARALCKHSTYDEETSHLLCMFFLLILLHETSQKISIFFRYVIVP